VVDALRCASEVQGCTAEPDSPGLHPVAENLATYSSVSGDSGALLTASSP